MGYNYYILSILLFITSIIRTMNHDEKQRLIEMNEVAESSPIYIQNATNTRVWTGISTHTEETWKSNRKQKVVGESVIEPHCTAEFKGTWGKEITLYLHPERKPDIQTGYNNASVLTLQNSSSHFAKNNLLGTYKITEEYTNCKDCQKDHATGFIVQKSIQKEEN